VATTACGGLGLSSKHVGMIMAISGALVIAYQALVFPLLSKRFEATQILMLMEILSSVFLLLLPLLSVIFSTVHLTDDTPSSGGNEGFGAPTWVKIILAAIGNSAIRMASTSAFVASNTFVNNSCAKGQRGTANGLSMACGSLTKSIGPVVGAALFAFTINDSSISFVGYKFSFVFLALQSAGWAAFTLRCIPSKLNHRQPS
jgi:hypothetical protein